MRVVLALGALAVACTAATAAPSSPALSTPASSAGPLDELITFDDLTTGGPGGTLTSVNEQYSSRGVTFNNVRAVDYSKGSAAISGFAHSGTIAVEQCIGAEFCTSPVAATFTAPQRQVRVWVGYTSPLSQAVNVQLKALNSSSATVGTATATLPASSAPTPIRTALQIDAGSASATRVEVSIPSGFTNGLAVDDVEFSTAGPPPTCSATAVPTVRLSLPAEGALVRANEFSLRGTVDNRGAPITGASVERDTGGGPRSLFPSGIGPNGGSFGPIRVTDLLLPGAQKVVVKATNCRGTGSAQVGVFWCRNNAPLAGSARVSTYAEIKEALTSCKKDVWVENNARIDLAAVGDNRSGAPNYVLHVPEGVTLASGRSPTQEGGLLYMSHRLVSQPHMLDLASNTRVTGLRLRGYDLTRTNNPNYTATVAIYIDAQDILVENNEISGWPTAAVEVHSQNTVTSAARVRITRNFIHNNVSCAGGGYGVVIGYHGFAYIDRNVFDFNRHDVAGDGLPGTGYFAQLNFVLTGGPTCDGFYNQHFDMHGTGGGSDHVGGLAGEYMLIRRNTIRGAQRYGRVGQMIRPAFELRGAPSSSALFIENTVAHADQFDAVRIKPGSLEWRLQLQRKRKLVIRGNRYGSDSSLQLAVGDFDGDGRADVFQPTGTLWAYSPGGKREWHVLADSSLGLDRLGFGDFNGDGKTDVFSQAGDRWRVSYGGASDWRTLPAGSNIDARSYRFGDFNGDRRSDVFRANGSHWFISSGGASGWRQLATSKLRVGDLRLGDFNADGKTDVFSLANGQWSVSYRGTTAWMRLNSRLSSDLDSLAFADFNGDRRTDVARSRGGVWEVSWGGTSGWRKLREGGMPPLSLMLFGDFTGDGRADVLQRAKLEQARPPATGLVPVSLDRYTLSSGGAKPLQPWSVPNLR